MTDDHRFGFSITHRHRLRPITLRLIGLGGLFSFWFGMGREAGPPVAPRQQSDSAAGEG